MYIQHPMVYFRQTFDGFHEEFAELQTKWKEIKLRANRIPDDLDQAEALPLLLALKADVEQFMSDMESHVNREKYVLYPIISQYGDITETEFAEKERTLAEMFIAAFCEDLEPQQLADPRQLLTFLRQSFPLLDHHMETEQNLVLKPAERIMHDLEYLSC